MKAVEFGGFWIRFAAFLIDLVVLLVGRWPISLFFWLISDDFSIWGGLRHGTANLGMSIIYFIIVGGIWFGYFIVMDVKRQATLGKMLFKLKVLKVDMCSSSYKEAALRETIGKFLSLIPCCLGFIWAGFDMRKQAWHDKIAETLVIRPRDDK